MLLGGRARRGGGRVVVMLPRGDALGRAAGAAAGVGAAGAGLGRVDGLGLGDASGRGDGAGLCNGGSSVDEVPRVVFDMDNGGGGGRLLGKLLGTEFSVAIPASLSFKIRAGFLAAGGSGGGLAAVVGGGTDAELSRLLPSTAVAVAVLLATRNGGLCPLGAGGFCSGKTAAAAWVVVVVGSGACCCCCCCCCCCGLSSRPAIFDFNAALPARLPKDGPFLADSECSFLGNPQLQCPKTDAIMSTLYCEHGPAPSFFSSSSS